jgi:5,10-methylenetetrahydrofolate reductase
MSAYISPDRKIIDIISSERYEVSVEFFPPKTSDGVEHLFDEISKLQKFDPKFADFTWVRNEKKKMSDLKFRIHYNSTLFSNSTL